MIIIFVKMYCYFLYRKKKEKKNNNNFLINKNIKKI